MREILEAAKKYLSRGWSVIPLEPQGKKPLIPWKEFQDRQATTEEVEKWFSAGNSNIGIVTGKISGITVIDCDSADAVRLAADKGLPTCPTVKTGKGYHFYYAYEPGVGNFQKRLDLPGIDLRGDGGFIVAPPSIHSTGAIYEFEGESRHKVPLPKWILQEKKVSSGSFSDYVKGATVGSRNDTLARLSGFMALSLPVQDAIEFAATWNSRNNPPLPMDEVRRTVESIYRAEASKPKVFSHGPIVEAESEPAHGEEPKEIFGFEDLSDLIDDMYQSGLPPGDSTGWKTLDPHYTVRRGEWTLITGIPGHGKSQMLDALMINLTKNSNWRFGIFSAENYPIQRHCANLIEILTGRPFSKGWTERMDKSILQAAKDFLTGRFYFLEPSEKRLNIDGIIELGTQMVEEKKIDGLVIDPWNELDHLRPTAMTETEYISRSLSKIRRMARKLRIHPFVVAHPTKLARDKNGEYPIPTPYDVSGSSHWRNKADNCITVWRDLKDENMNPFTQVYVQKIRFKEIGKIGSVDLRYDKVCGQYHDVARN